MESARWIRSSLATYGLFDLKVAASDGRKEASMIMRSLDCPDFASSSPTRRHCSLFLSRSKMVIQRRARSAEHINTELMMCSTHSPVDLCNLTRCIPLNRHFTVTEADRVHVLKAKRSNKVSRNPPRLAAHLLTTLTPRREARSIATFMPPPVYLSSQPFYLTTCLRNHTPYYHCHSNTQQQTHKRHPSHPSPAPPCSKYSSTTLPNSRMHQP